MTHHKLPFTVVQASGAAEADHDAAYFSGVAYGRGKTHDTAKRAVKKIIDALEAVTMRLIADGRLVPAASQTKTAVSVQVEQKYDEKSKGMKAVGSLATYSFSFLSLSVDYVSEVFDALSAVEGAEIAQPDFRVQNIEGLQSAAFRDALVKANRRFASECEALGTKAEGFKVVAYQARYDESMAVNPGSGRGARAQLMSARGAAASSSEESPIEIKSGKAAITVTLSVSYDRSGIPLG